MSFRSERPGKPRRLCLRLGFGLSFGLSFGLGLGALGSAAGRRAFLHRHVLVLVLGQRDNVFGQRDERLGRCWRGWRRCC
jgi:hypothetical protein